MAERLPIGRYYISRSAIPWGYQVSLLGKPSIQLSLSLSMNIFCVVHLINSRADMDYELETALPIHLYNIQILAERNQESRAQNFSVHVSIYHDYNDDYTF